MGKIKQKLVTRTARELQERGIEFSEEFEQNKKVLGREMPSKKIRNQMAGYLARVKKQQAAKEKMLETK